MEKKKEKMVGNNNMRFKLHGEKDDGDDEKTNYGTVVEILGKKAIERFVEDKVKERVKDLERQVSDLRDRVYKLEEELIIKRREILKLEGKYNE